MTEHVMPEDFEEDQRVMRSLGKFVGAFAVFTALLAIGVALFAP